MNKQDLRIVFMGTPDFAVESLRVLVENNYNVVGVITMPDKPAGRGHKIQYSAVKSYALTQNLPVLQPEKLKDKNFHKELKAWKADLQIVVAFRMLPEVVWNMPRLGTFNLHASLLPQYRGAAPINWAIMNGDKETGATTFFLTHEIDTGKIILQEKLPIGDSDNVGKIHDELMVMGAQLVKRTVDLLLEGKTEAIPQDQFFKDEEELKPAPKIFKETCRIDWNQSVEKIYNHIRGLSPHPAAWTKLYSIGKDPIIVKIYKSDYIKNEEQQNTNRRYNGKVLIENRSLTVKLKTGYIIVTELQFPDKKKMDIISFLNGYTFNKYSSFSFLNNCDYIDAKILNILSNNNIISESNILNLFIKEELNKEELNYLKKSLKDRLVTNTKQISVNKKDNMETFYSITEKGLENYYLKYKSFFFNE
ncbi:methionyl-tRNA formyltransferase [Dysgonomonas capnocytophagoides]|uniref:Methionyl-tRNA formyltransferase n=1 Tax=Dysgonomonas capnocytophagoides TaxID=45254 RepID=A0A4Y8L9N7_9BACT|nr:methionyl-tRNA formyltransferase [Dysgonomonas capnocytophagoides]